MRPWIPEKKLNDSFLLGCSIKSLQSLLKLHSQENTDKSEHWLKVNEQSSRDHNNMFVLLCNILGSKYFLSRSVFKIVSDFVLLKICLEIGTGCLWYTWSLNSREFINAAFLMKIIYSEFLERLFS